MLLVRRGGKAPPAAEGGGRRWCGPQLRGFGFLRWGFFSYGMSKVGGMSACRWMAGGVKSSTMARAPSAVVVEEASGPVLELGRITEELSGGCWLNGNNNMGERRSGVEAPLTTRGGCRRRNGRVWRAATTLVRCQSRG